MSARPPLSRWQEAALQPRRRYWRRKGISWREGPWGPQSALLTLGGGQSRAAGATDRRGLTPQSTARAGPGTGVGALSPPDPPAFTQVGQAPSWTHSHFSRCSPAGVRERTREPAEKAQDCPSPAELAPWVQRKVPQHRSLHLNA